MNLLSIADLNRQQITQLLNETARIKQAPSRYRTKRKHHVLLTFFALPSLRTEVSFDVAMYELGGEVIDYHAETSPWGARKESIEDMAKVLSRYVDIVLMRLPDDQVLRKFAANATIPVINGLTTREHPCQVLSDLFTIREHYGSLKGRKLTYLGDGNNNVTHSLLLGCALTGMDITISCPSGYRPQTAIVREARRLARGNVRITSKPTGDDADIVYTDSWMSYAIPKHKAAKRRKDLQPYKVTQALMRTAQPDALFMHCLPAQRSMEVTKSVIDGEQSIVFTQAENRLHLEKALLLGKHYK